MYKVLQINDTNTLYMIAKNVTFHNVPCEQDFDAHLTYAQPHETSDKYIFRKKNTSSIIAYF